MGRFRPARVLFLLGSLILFLGTANDVLAQKAGKESKAIAENQELDRQLLEAFQQKDVAAVMSFYWNSPDLVVVFPDGTVHRGWEGARQGFEQLFATMESIRGEITEVSHLPSGDGVAGVGTGTMYFQPKGGAPQQATIRFTDFRRKQGGKWVYVYDHLHALPPMPKPTDPLYKRLGGYDAIAAVVDDFLVRLIGDPEITRFFGGASTESKKRIRQLVVDQLCAATGGPCIYIGRDMKSSHAGLGITGRDWELAVNHLVATLEKFRVPAKEKNEVLAAISGLKPDIVEK